MMRMNSSRDHWFISQPILRTSEAQTCVFLALFNPMVICLTYGVSTNPSHIFHHHGGTGIDLFLSMLWKVHGHFNVCLMVRHISMSLSFRPAFRLRKT